MLKIIRNGMAALTAVALANLASAHSNAELTSELNLVEIQIEAARSVADSHGEPAVRQMAQERLAVLQLTRAILQNRIISLEGGATVEVEVAATPPDMAEVARLPVKWLWSKTQSPWPKRRSKTPKACSERSQ